MNDESSGIDLAALLEIFLAESRDRLDRMEDSVRALDNRPEDLEPLHEIFRGVHTLKGDGASLGFLTVSSLAHRAEDVLDQLRSGGLNWDGGIGRLMMRVVDALRRHLNLARDARSPEIDALEEDLARTAERATVGLGGRAPASFAGGEVESAAPTTLRVPIQAMDRLLDTVGEILVARESLRTAIAEAPEPWNKDLLERLSTADELYRNLQELVMSSRLVPLGPMFRSLRRVLRDAEARCGKLVDLEIDDSGVEVDARLVECLRAPLGHLMRNAVDHGIEEPERRRRAGKPERGRATLSAELEAGILVVRLSDDGAGIDRKQVAEKASALGMPLPSSELSDRQLLRVLTAPGFSTAANATEVSGRGVGLDAVARAVSLVRGSMDLRSVPGGTEFSLRLPLLVSILEGFHLRVGNEDYVVPLEQVSECLEAPLDLPRGVARGMFELHGEPLPYLRLRSTLGASGPGAERESVVVVEAEQRRFGLVVDELVGSRQCVVKAMGGLLRRVPGVFGTTLLGTGRVALILDLVGLVGMSGGAIVPEAALR